MSRVRATRDSDKGDTLRMRIRVVGQVVRTRLGPVAAAPGFLELREQAGATVTYHIESSSSS